ncbi:MAG: hypothetical protein KBT46_01730 [Ruminococcus sp.]|nr:hypothetical protein [Candidatus Copronaster equi]
MKKIISAVMVLIILVGCSACGNKNKNPEKYSSIIATYSVNSDEKKFIVEVQNLGGVYDQLYDKNGLIIDFYGSDDEVYDKDGNKISRKDLTPGDTLRVQYDGKLSKKNPKTIKAYKVSKVD